MAEIKIEKKKPVWPWILLILGILALLYFLFTQSDDDDFETDDETEIVADDATDDRGYEDTDVSQIAASEISAYQTYINDDAKMGIDHTYSNGALVELIDATEALAESLDVDLNADLDSARSYASTITSDPYEVDHADKIRKSGKTIVDALSTIQKQKYPNLESDVNELRNTIMGIAPEIQTLEQKTAVKDFFQQSADLLINMK